MRKNKGLRIFFALLLIAALFIWHTSNRLPAMVASHFGSGGIANGFMPHDFYVRFTLAFVIGLPALMAFMTTHSLGKSNARINLPNRDYWLGPEQYANTIAYLRSSLIRFCTTLLVFLCYMHWLVVVANTTQPAHLSEFRLVTGLAVFLGATFLWLRGLLKHFRQTSA